MNSTTLFALTEDSPFMELLTTSNVDVDDLRYYFDRNYNWYATVAAAEYQPENSRLLFYLQPAPGYSSLSLGYQAISIEEIEAKIYDTGQTLDADAWRKFSDEMGYNTTEPPKISVHTPMFKIEWKNCYP